MAWAPAILTILLSGLGAGACIAPAPYQRGDVYLALYRPLAPPPGGVVVSLTASFEGVLAVREGCLVMMAHSGEEASLPAFHEQVRLVTRGGKVGIEDTASGATAFVGDALSLGGASAPEGSDFATTRLIAPPPPACPRRIFVSNSGFEKS